MMTIHQLTEHYAQWLQQRPCRGQKNILDSFRSLVQNCHRNQHQSDIKGLYLTSHVTFLSHVLTSSENYTRTLFPLGIILLNFVLKQKPKIRIELSPRFITGIHNYFRERLPCNCGGRLVSSVLWLICKCIQGSCDKRATLERLAESGLITDFLQRGELDWQGEKAIALLLYFTAKQDQNRERIIALLLENQAKFKHPEGIRYVLATLKEATVRSLRQRADLRSKLGGFLVRYMGMEQVAFSQKLGNIELIASVVYRQRELLGALRVEQIIQQKLSSPLSDDDPNILSVMRLLVASAKGAPAICHILQLAISTLTFNAASRRVFILFHEYLNEPQLIELMGSVPCMVERLLGSMEGRENGLKVLICLKRAAGRLGLNRVFWCTCRRLVKQALTLRAQQLSLACLELFELFEQIIKEEIEILPLF